MLVLVAPVAHADWAIGKYPFLPTLQDTAAAPVCQPLLKQATEQFKSDITSIDLNRLDTDSEPAIHPVQWQEVPYPDSYDPNQRSLDTMFRANLDLDGDGKAEVVVYRSFVWSWRPPAITAGVFKSDAAFQQALKDYSTYENVMAAAQKFFNGAGEMNTVFEYQGRYFFVEAGRYSGRHQAETIVVNRLAKTGIAEPVCNIVVRPKTNLVESYPSIRAYLNVLQMLGSAGPDCGTAHLALMHDERGRGAMERLGYRPWAAHNSGSPGYSSRTESLLFDWSNEDVWNQREYRTFKQHFEDARLGLRRYLANEFGVEGAALDSYSGLLLDDLTGSFFMFPSDDYQLYSAKYTAYILQIVDGQFDLKAKLSPSAGLALMPFMVDNPELLERAMALGIDPEQPNWFGKTLLMVAAHLNREDSVKVLLKSGADVKAATREIEKRSYCMGKLSRLNRSALTYAAENASKEIIALLVDAGSDLAIKDTKGNPLEWYLAKNPRLTEAEKSMSVKALVDEYKKQNAPASASFDCRKAASRTEKAICGNAQLKLFDRELGNAYTRWLSVTPSPQDDRSSQRSWLQYRNTTCSEKQGQSFVLCLQQETRARTRMYLNKLIQVEKIKAAAKKS